ncbi:MAG: hypothetical protein AAGN35_20180 [Bacteroidota bacterium]
MTRSLKIAAFALLGVTILWACGGEALDAKGTAEQFLKAMKTRDFDAAKAMATEEGVASIEMVASAPGEAGNADDIVVTNVEEDGDKAVATYTDAGKEMTLNLVKEGGEWKAAFSKMDGGGANPLDDIGKEIEGAFDEAMDEAAKELDNLGGGEGEEEATMETEE